MTSPARAHYLRCCAEEHVPQASLAENHGYQLMQMKLGEDKRRLKAIQSKEKKAELKQALLPEYQPWLEGVLAADTGENDVVLMTVLVWRIDAGDYVGALELARYALKHRLPMPDQFNRNVPTVLVEELADAAKRQRDGGGQFAVNVLTEVVALTEHEDMPDEVRAKLHKELGLLLEAVDPEQAVQHLRRAQQLHEAIGVKKSIESIERKIKHQASS